MKKSDLPPKKKSNFYNVNDRVLEKQKLRELDSDSLDNGLFESFDASKARIISRRKKLKGL